ncbi:MAG: hypothetical protein BZ138_03350 [Methanosphaera sp. rholeuAM270]|nr:MAG: hypothetical protein BZ138_03350 [Methanosphaera sp. rholeuAM270]
MSYDDLNLQEEQFTQLRTVGLDNYLFLNNDTNYELKQHYVENFKNKFDEKRFRESYNSKREYCEKRGIEYKFYVIPDKSVVCKDYLPITPKNLKRNYYSIQDLVPDFIDILDASDYYKSDSHINYKGAIKYSAEMMHDIRPQVSSQKYLEAIKENVIHRRVRVDGDLCKFKNPREDQKEIVDRYDYPFLEYSNQYEYSDNPFVMPEEFAKVGIRDSFYMRNRFSLTDMDCLLFRSSAANRYMDVLNVFFKSIFAYWDHWNFNTDLIEWYQPNVIIELRPERFLENMKYEIID